MSVWLGFRDVEYVTKIATTGNITKAAQELMISQPALSIYIKKLEERLGLKLFNKVGHKFILTYAGERVLQKGTEILRLRDQLRTEIDDIVVYGTGRLRVGVPYVRGISFLPPSIKRFQQEYPNVKVEICEDDAQILMEKVIRGDLDVIFINQLDAVDPELEYRPILTDPIVLFTCTQPPFKVEAINRHGFSHPWIDLAKLKDQPFIMNYPNQKTYQLALRIYEDYQFEPKICMQVQNQLTAIHLAAQGCGLYLAPEYFAQNILLTAPTQIFSIGKEAPYSMEFGATWRKDAYPAEIIQAFIDIAQNTYSYR